MFFSLGCLGKPSGWTHKPPLPELGREVLLALAFSIIFAQSLSSIIFLRQIIDPSGSPSLDIMFRFPRNKELSPSNSFSPADKKPNPL